MQYQIPAEEYNTLVDLYNSTGGSAWTTHSGWLNPNATTWKGVQVDYVIYDTNGNVLVPGNIIGLDERGNNLVGTTPDSVGNLTHSQGGVLARMLCQNFGPSVLGPGAPFAASPAVSAYNAYRGRFRRIITIGSPHNGSLLLHVGLELQKSSDQNIRSLYNISDLVRLMQPKFDPFGSQITNVNNGSLYPIDRRVKFNCIGTAIASGQPPGPSASPLIYVAAGLCFPSPGDTLTRGQRILPGGSDGIVDYYSEFGGAGTPGSAIGSPDLSHADKEGLFGLPTGQGQTTSSECARVVTHLLDGPASAFGPFVLPNPLPDSLRQLVDSLESTVTGVDLHRPVVQSGEGQYALNVPASVPVSGNVKWTAENYGPSGVSSQGITLDVNPVDSTKVAVSFDSTVIGDVVLQAIYTTTNGDIVTSTPVLIEATNPTGPLTGIELRPSAITASVGDSVNVAIWGHFRSGVSRELYIPPGQANYICSDRRVADCDQNGNAVLKSIGTAALVAAYKGFVAQMLLSSFQPSVGTLSLAKTTNGASWLTFRPTVGTTNVIQISSNLLDWEPLAAIFSTSGFAQFLDTTATNFPHRFYRAVIPDAGSMTLSPFAWIFSENKLLDGSFQFSSFGTPGTTNLLQVSTNLSRWEALATVVNTNGTFQYTDSSATNINVRFYRVLLP